MVRSVKMGKGGASYLDPFQYWVDRLKPADADIRCLPVDESLTIGGIECGMHGDRGPNGARGTINSFRRLGVRVVSGHGHTPGIEEGHYRNGTMTHLRLEYTHGPSSWMNTHTSIDALGKRHLHNIIGGRFCDR